MYFKEIVSSVAFSGNEVLIREPHEPPTPPPSLQTSEEGEKEEVIIKGKKKKEERDELKRTVYLRFQLPKGKVASIMGVMNYLQSKFEVMQIEITAEEGEISNQDYEDKILEAFRQIGVEP